MKISIVYSVLFSHLTIRFSSMDHVVVCKYTNKWNTLLLNFGVKWIHFTMKIVILNSSITLQNIWNSIVYHNLHNYNKNLMYYEYIIIKHLLCMYTSMNFHEYYILWNYRWILHGLSICTHPKAHYTSSTLSLTILTI